MRCPRLPALEDCGKTAPHLQSRAASSRWPAACLPGNKLNMQEHITTLGAVDMAAQIRSGQLSARDLMQAHLARIEAVNPKVNAIVTLHAEQAMAAALAADEAQAHCQPLGPLHGLPVAHKDLIMTRGMRTTYGSRVHANY